jgi:hypothetical protein
MPPKSPRRHPRRGPLAFGFLLLWAAAVGGGEPPARAVQIGPPKHAGGCPGVMLLAPADAVSGSCEALAPMAPTGRPPLVGRMVRAASGASPYHATFHLILPPRPPVSADGTWPGEEP